MVTQVNAKTAVYLADKTGSCKDFRRCASDGTLLRCRGDASSMARQWYEAGRAGFYRSGWSLKTPTDVSAQ